MIKFLKIFSFLPFINRFIQRKYYATGFGTYLVNSFFKTILRINTGDFLIHFSSRVNKAKNIKIIGENKSPVYLSFATSGGCYYQGLNGIEIGEGTIWSYNCIFISSNHDFKDLKAHIKTPPISIGKYVWLGANCVVLPGVSIGDNVIVGAGSVVTKSFPDNVIIAGNPAKILAYRCSICGEKKTENNCSNCSKD